MKKLYIGDGVYVEFDGYGLVLTTENGVSITNRIVLEPQVFTLLTEFIESLKSEAAERREDEQAARQGRTR